MMMIVALVGRVVREPELRRLEGGKIVLNNSIACERKWKDKQGVMQKKTSFIPFTLWDTQAENFKKFCAKGSIIGLNGYLENKEETVEGGGKRYWIEFMCQNVQYIYTQRNPDEKEDSYRSKTAGMGNIDNASGGDDGKVPF